MTWRTPRYTDNTAERTRTTGSSSPLRMSHRELHPRFHSHLARQRRVRIGAATALTVCLLVGTATAFALTDQSDIRASLARNIASARAIASGALTSISNIPARAHFENTIASARTQLAAASSLSWLDTLSDTLYRTFCTFFNDCPRADFASTAPPAPQLPRPPQPTPQPPQFSQTDQTTTSQKVKLADPQPTHPTGQPPQGGTATNVAVSPPNTVSQNSASQTVTGGVSEAMFNARLAALKNDLLARIAQVGSGQSGGSAPISITSSSGAYVTTEQFARQIDATGESLRIVSESAAANTPTLTDTTIPDDITASNYLPLTGGTLTGALTGTDLTLSGNLTVSGAQTLSGAITIPYLSATSTTASSFINASTTRLSVFDTAYFGSTATSTFSSTGFLALPSGFLSQASSTIGAGGQTTGLTISGGATTTGNAYFVGNVGVGTTDPSTGKLVVVGSTGLPQLIVSATGATGLRIFSWGSTDVNFDPTANNTKLHIGRDFTLSQTTFESGNVGIGTTSPYAKLSVIGPVVAEYFHATSTAATSTFSGGLTTGSSGLNVLTNGNVGIGTTSPPSKLSIVSADPAAPYSGVGLFTGSDTSYTAYTVGRTGVDAYFGVAGTANHYLAGTVQGDVLLMGAGNGKLYLSAAGIAGAPAQTITTTGNVGIGTTSPYAKLSVVGEVVASHFTATSSTASLFNGGLLSLASTTIGAGGQATGLTISGGATTTGRFLAQNSTDSTTGFQIKDADGGTPILNVDTTDEHVGIWTTSPNAQLSLGSNTADQKLLLYDDGLASNNYGLGIQAAQFRLQAADGARFSFINNLNGGIEVMSVLTTGNVGIGTTSPYAKLSVVGPVVAEYFHATSTSATSTFAGGALFATGGGNVGIGTTGPNDKLEVGGNIALSGALKGNEIRSNNFFLLDLDDDNNSTTDFFHIRDGGNGEIFTVLENSGNVGIGESSPGSKLSVSGGATIGSGYDTTAAPTNGLLVEGNLGIGTTTPRWALQIASSTGPQLALSDTSGTSNPWTFRSISGNLYVATASPSTSATSSVTALTINSSGNVGIGTTTPSQKFVVQTSSDVNGFAHTDGTVTVGSWVGSGVGQLGTISNHPLEFFTNNDDAQITLLTDGNVGIGTTTPPYKLSIYDPTGAGLMIAGGDGSTGIDFVNTGASDKAWGFYSLGTDFHLFEYNSTVQVGTGIDRVTFKAGGNVGIATTSPWRTFSVDGTVSLKNMTAAEAGSVLCLSASNEVTTDSTPASPCSSSLLANKQNVADLAVGLDAVMRLRPVEFDWKDGFGRGHDLGFIAEEVQEAAPILADYNLDGSLSSVKYTQVGALLTKAIQEIASITGTFKSNLAAWLADAANGITDFFARRGHFQEQLCVGDTCVTPEQFAEVFGNQSAGQSAAANASVIEGNSEAPASATAQEPGSDADAATSSTAPDPTPSTSNGSSTSQSAANDNEPAASNSEPQDVGEAAVEESEPPPQDEPVEQVPADQPPTIPAAANDNSPPSAEQLSTGTE